MFFSSIALLLAARFVDARNTALFGERNISKFSDGRDLARYVSRPDLRPPILNITQYDPIAISPGYWFVAPYGTVTATPLQWDYQPYEAGPLIYDNAGNLVWSGAPMLQHRNVFDFRAVRYNGSDHLTFVIGNTPHNLMRTGPDDLQFGIITDSAYRIHDRVNVNRHGTIFDIHEFHVIEDGKTALMTTTKVQLRDVSEVGVEGLTEKRVANKGFQEVDIATGHINFEWDALENGVSLSESYNVRELVDPSHSYWDFFHINAVDKGKDGNYLISARYTNTIYKISGTDGSIIWRLGGEISDFQLLDGLNFTSQHHARIRSENETVTMITFFDNASDDEERQPPTSRCSSGKLVALYTTTSPMTAKLIQQWERPDGLLTDRRGNNQVLPNTNVVVNWGDNGYLSEFTADGRHLLDAKYISARFGNYRAFKFNFTGSPEEPPALKTYAYGSGTSAADMVSVFYVSWNGATEVAKWNFYGAQDDSREFSMVGSAAKSGFETSYMSTRYLKYTYAEALSEDGRFLGKSGVQKTILPNGLDEKLIDLDVPNTQHDGSTETPAGHDSAETPPEHSSTTAPPKHSSTSASPKHSSTAAPPKHSSTAVPPQNGGLPLARQSLGPVAVVLIAIILAFALLGMAALVYFLWNRKALLSRGVYAPVTSSDSIDSSELSALAYHDQEAEK